MSTALSTSSRPGRSGRSGRGGTGRTRRPDAATTAATAAGSANDQRHDTYVTTRPDRSRPSVAPMPLTPPQIASIRARLAGSG
jgi:hypothetical protein